MRLAKKNAFMAGAALLAAALALLAILCSGLLRPPPYTFLAKELKENVDAAPMQAVYQEALGNGKHIVICYNAKGRLMLAFLEEGLLSYKRVELCGELAPDQLDLPADTMFSCWESGLPVEKLGRAWVCWGVLHSPTFAQVRVNGLEARVLEAEGLHLFYTLGECEEQPERMTFQFMDANGQEVYHAS